MVIVVTVFISLLTVVEVTEEIGSIPETIICYYININMYSLITTDTSG